jgi:hypothetical protein
VKTTSCNMRIAAAIGQPLWTFTAAAEGLQPSNPGLY